MIVKEEAQKVREARFHKIIIGLKGVCNYGIRNVNGLEAWMLMLGLVRGIVWVGFGMPWCTWGCDGPFLDTLGQHEGEQEQSNTTTYINHVKPWCSRPLDGHGRVWETHGAHAGACLGPSWALLGCSAGRFGHPLGHVGVSWPVSRHIDDTYG